MNLIVVESPSKAKTINKYLGKDYKVISSLGHLIDLPKSRMGVDIQNGYQPEYVVIRGRENVVQLIKEEAKKASNLILATDPDREGEAIAWHIYNLVSSINQNIQRITFHEITKDSILRAISNPSHINIDLVHAQQARRVLDRLVGYTLSPLLWRKIRYGLSAGRVQSVALRLVVDRELERRSFKPQEYWDIKVIVSSQKPDETKVNTFLSTKNKNQDSEELHGSKDTDISHVFGDEANTGNLLAFDMKSINSQKLNVISKEEFDEIVQDLLDSYLTIENVEQSNVRRKPDPPFITSTFQQACVNVLGISAKNAMKIAQKLYENGFITYMRTDSYNLSDQSVKAMRDIIKHRFGPDYVPEKQNIYKNKSRNAQEAHEAIRPTDFSVLDLGRGFSSQEQKVYDLIYKRALASQMREAEFLKYTVVAFAENQDKTYKFTSTFTDCTFGGWLDLYDGSNRGSQKGGQKLEIIKNLKPKASYYFASIMGYQRYTEPKPRYTEASLIKDLDKYGIGRPSTYATILSIIVQRDYISKEGKYLRPTEIGELVVRMLKQHFPEIVDIDFTARVEEDLDKIATGELDWIKFVDSFYKPFEKTVTLKDKEIDKNDLVVIGESDETCEICGKRMVKKIGKFGLFLSCMDFPKCKGIKSLNAMESDSEGPDVDLSLYESPPTTEDNKTFLLKKSKYGYFWAHPDYPKVKDARPLLLKNEVAIKLFGDPPQASDGTVMVLKKGRYGYFWAHPDYPRVREIVRINKSLQRGIC